MQGLMPGPSRTKYLAVLQLSSKGELSLIRSLRDQLKCAQQELKMATTKVDVALSKVSLATDAEKFLLGEIENLGKAVECKFFRAFDLFFFWLASSDHLFLSDADACLDSKAKAHRVNAHLHAAQTHANSIAGNFWADRSKAMKLTVLQDRISQAGVLAKTSRAALALVH
jgi:hypothetical protein